MFNMTGFVFLLLSEGIVGDVPLELESIEVLRNMPKQWAVRQTSEGVVVAEVKTEAQKELEARERRANQGLTCIALVGLFLVIAMMIALACEKASEQRGDRCS